MYRVVVCDDEKEILSATSEKIKTCLLQKDIFAECIGFYDSRKLMEFIQREKVDILFLDIDMPHFNGMDIAGFINEKGLQTILVFVTSHDALVYQTFAYRPFGFLRKTHIDVELEELAERIKKELVDRKQELILTKGQDIVKIPIRDIVYIESEGNYINIIQKNHTVKFRGTLMDMEEKLAGKNFIRCHKGYLVNGDYIEKLKSSQIIMKYEKENKAIPIGRSYDKDVRKRFLELFRS